MHVLLINNESKEKTNHEIDKTINNQLPIPTYSNSFSFVINLNTIFSFNHYHHYRRRHHHHRVNGCLADGKSQNEINSASAPAALRPAVRPIPQRKKVYRNYKERTIPRNNVATRASAKVLRFNVTPIPILFLLLLLLPVCWLADSLVQWFVSCIRLAVID